jgi:hypothetical protein
MVNGYQNHRITAIFATPLPVKQPGVLRFQSKVRLAGTQTWQTQSYTIRVEELTDHLNEANQPDSSEKKS